MVGVGVGVAGSWGGVWGEGHDVESSMSHQRWNRWW